LSSSAREHAREVDVSSYRVSYSDDKSGTQVTNDHAIEMGCEALLELMDRVLQSEGSFVNVEDTSGRVMTFMVDDAAGGLLLDVPCNVERGSYTKHTTLAACCDALRSMDGTIDRSKIDGLSFERW
jgi:hypothetical protein